MTKRTDTAGRATIYLYDNASRVTRVTDPAQQATNFEYNARSQMTALVDALNQRYEFSFDSLGRVTQSARAGVSMSCAYDAVGNRTQRTDYNGIATNYAYDALNRMTTITYPGNQTTTYGYDALSRLSAATNANGTVTLGYDSRGDVLSTTDAFGQVIGYSYDSNGNRIGMTLNGSTYAGYAYDAANRLLTLADNANLSFNYNYDAANRLTSRSAPNGVTTGYAYDGLDRLTALTHSQGATTLISNQYTYNDANNIASWTSASGSHAYTYDALDRLTSATNSAQPNESYSYDPVGNRTASHLSASYSYQPFNKLTSTASATYSYDSNGNLTSKTDSLGTWTFTYDYENRLTQVAIPGGLTVHYKYDALGRRIQRTTSAGANERYAYDNADVLEDLNADGSVATTYFNDLGIDNHLRQTNSATGISYFLNDHLGTTSALTDGSGNVVEQLAYDSFGNSSGSARTRYGYTGRERDPDTGMLYYRARFYDPQVGRFISEDPIQLEGGINPYAYVKNEPLRFMDPFGLTRCNRLLGVLGGGMLGAGAGGLLGEGAMVAAGGIIGSAVGPGGTIVGFIVGGVGGAPISVVTAAGGAVAGSIIGYIYCAKDDARPQPRAIPTCDNPPKAIPMPPPPDGEQTCARLRDLCLERVWQPSWNRRMFGPKKDCGSCYRQCKLNQGVWPFDRCPIFHK